MELIKTDRLITLRRLDYTAGELTTHPDMCDFPIRVQLQKGNADEA